MNIHQLLDIYQLISESSNDISSRKQTILLRKAELNPGIKKIAFDTRRIDQETEFNPRRGLQNYHRSEQFITEAISQKIKNFMKLKTILDDLKSQYGKEPEWQDSYARVLLNTLEKTLRSNEKDGDYVEGQPGIGSFDYVEELLYVRYRLDVNNIKTMSESQLKKLILDKDEVLTTKDVNNVSCEVSKRDVATQGYDTLLEKLFSGVKADKDNKSVQRTVTITIKDDYLDE